jgi:hypothetical protein
MAAALRTQLALGEELLAVVARENGALREGGDFSSSDFFQQRKKLLPLLDRSLGGLKKHRQDWLRLTPVERGRHPEIAALIRANQELIMQIIVLDRENEQALLRRGLVPPRQWPSAHRQRPNYVASLYRRHGTS